MSATTADSEVSARAVSSGLRRTQIFTWSVSTACIGVLVWVVAADAASVSAVGWEVIVWVLLAAASDLLLVRFGHGAALSMSLAVTLAAGMLFPPAVVAVIAFAGSLDEEELRGRAPLYRIVFNRSQVAISAAAAAAVFQSSGVAVIDWPAALAWILLALSADFACNAILVALTLHVQRGTGFWRCVSDLFGTVPSHTAMLYLATALMAPLMAIAYLAVGVGGVLVALMPLAIGRFGLETSRLLQATKAALERSAEAVRSASERAGDERRDERRVLAGEIHDDLLPALFKVHLMAQVTKHDLASGRLFDLERDAADLVDTVEIAQRIGRDLVGGLRSSALGPRGLESSLRLQIQQLEEAGSPRIALQIDEVRANATAQLVAYQVVREALNNAAKYSRSEGIGVTVGEIDGALNFSVADGGTGFDVGSVDASTHFGIQLMRERVLAYGGSLVIDSRLGHGTVVSGSLPLAGELDV